MAKTVLLLLLVTAPLHAGSSQPVDRKDRGSQMVRGPYASWDEINLVAHGLLQLGQGLKEHVEKTRAQMKDVIGRLRTLNNTLVALAPADQGHLVHAPADPLGQAPGDRLGQGPWDRLGQAPVDCLGQGPGDRLGQGPGDQLGQGPGDQLGQGPAEIGKDVARVESELAGQLLSQVEEGRLERLSLRSWLERLEVKVDRGLRKPWLEGNSSDNGETASIQRTLEAQNRRIDDLLEKIRQQQDNLEKQGLHLQALQTKVGERRTKVRAMSHHDTSSREVLQNKDQPSAVPRDCQEVFRNGERANGVYTVQPTNSVPFNVLCEITSDGGWTVIQKRHDGSQNFNQLWVNYRKGFGNLNSEFWLGLDHIHSLSNQGLHTMQVLLSNRTGEQQVVNYLFRLDGPERHYALHLQPTSPSGIPAGAMETGASGLPFSTLDQDNDLRADVNCAKSLSGGWWFSGCGEWNLNGRYPKRHLYRQRSSRQQMSWATTSKGSSALKSVVMKIRPSRH